MSDHPDDPTDDDLRALPGPAGPPAALEERVVAALRERGLLAPRRRGRRLLLLAAGLACFAAGWIGRDQAAREDAAGDGTLYLLLLSQLPEPSDSTTEARLVEEYRSWASALRRQGHLVRAEKLGREMKVLGGTTSHDGTMHPSGFFLIRAATIEEATALARECPHLRHGGSITVRSVDAT